MAGVPASSRGISLADNNVWAGNQTAAAWIASGLTGATAGSRYVGATASGAPASGTFAVGDFVIDQTGKLWVCTIAGTPGTWTQVGGSLGSSAWFGDGSDGAGAFDGSTAVLGVSPAAGVYTQDRDWFFASMTIASGVRINTNGYRIFCNGTCTGADATSIVAHNGNPASGSTGGTTLPNANGSLDAFTASAVFGTAGGNGGTAGGSAGTNSAASVYHVARGGSGGAGSGGAGGSSGTINTPATNQGGYRSWTMFAGMFLTPNAGAGALSINGGTGGGGGGGDGTAGGGGGGGGGVCVVFIKTFAGTGVVQARGGAGGNAAAGNRGGGGGGGGGFLYVLSQSVVSGAISGWTCDANGGAPGTKQGTGVDGTVGNNGVALLIPA